jgi:response regulator RpfG family c-di-GMP phosphodiesterase
MRAKIRSNAKRLLDTKLFPSSPAINSALEFPVGFFSLACDWSPSYATREGKNRVLIVGSDGSGRAWLGTFFEREGQVEVFMASEATSAVALLQQHACPVLVLDLSSVMNGGRSLRMNGLGLLSRVKAMDPTIQVIGIVDHTDLELALEMMRAGAFECLTTPEVPERLVSCVGQAVERRRQIMKERAYYELIERAVYQRTRDLNTMFCELEEAYRQTLWALGSALESRDVETNAHSFRVMKYSQALAAAMGINGKALKDIEYGVFLHDIGKIGVADAILFKPDKLTEEEWDVMREHPARGRYLLAGIKFLEGGLDIVYSHHERWDGQGYPQGLRAESIPLGARIFAVGDTLDAMTSDRPYRKALDYETARNEIITNSGIQFDPEVVKVFHDFDDVDWGRLREEAEELAESIVRRKQDSLRL